MLLPTYRMLIARESFAKLSQQHRIDQLREAIDDPDLAQAMRTWSPLLQSAVLAQLTRLMIERPTRETVELWRLRRDGVELVAVTVALDGGAMDLRLIDHVSGEFRVTQRCEDGGIAGARAQKWRDHLQAVGWS